MADRRHARARTASLAFCSAWQETALHSNSPLQAATHTRVCQPHAQPHCLYTHLLINSAAAALMQLRCSLQQHAQQAAAGNGDGQVPRASRCLSQLRQVHQPTLAQLSILQGTVDTWLGFNINQPWQPATKLVSAQWMPATVQNGTHMRAQYMHAQQQQQHTCASIPATVSIAACSEGVLVLGQLEMRGRPSIRAAQHSCCDLVSSRPAAASASTAATRAASVSTWAAHRACSCVAAPCLQEEQFSSC